MLDMALFGLERGKEVSVNGSFKKERMNEVSMW